MLFVGQESSYVYDSEGVIFKESPAFVLTLEKPAPTKKTQSQVKTVKIEKKAETKPFKINLSHYVQGDLNLIGESSFVSHVSFPESRKRNEPDIQAVNERTTPPVKIEERKSDIVVSLPAQAGASGGKVIETVYFDFDSFELKSEEKKKLDSLSRDINYRVTGYTCDIGEKSYNDRLALKRARAVKDYLGDIVKEVDGKGKCCYVDLRERWRNRRVEIKPINK